jgi:hypothetical protein
MKTRILMAIPVVIVAMLVSYTLVEIVVQSIAPVKALLAK